MRAGDGKERKECEDERRVEWKYSIEDIIGQQIPRGLARARSGVSNEAGTLGKVVQLGRLSLSTGAISDVVVETIRLLAWVGPLAPGGPQEGLSWACGEWI